MLNGGRELLWHVLRRPFPCRFIPSTRCPPVQGEAGALLQRKDGELQGSTNRIRDLEATVALLHARIEHQQQQTVAQVRGGSREG